MHSTKIRTPPLYKRSNGYSVLNGEIEDDFKALVQIEGTKQTGGGKIV